MPLKHFSALSLFTCLAALTVFFAVPSGAQAPQPGALSTPAALSTSAKLHPVLLRRFSEAAGPVKAWVFFTDKGVQSPEELREALQQVARDYDPRAVQRRARRGNNAARGGALFDEHDLPVDAGYIDGVVGAGAKLHIASRWLNAVSVWATRAQAERIAALPFVDRLEAVRRTRPDRPLNVQEVGAAPPAAGEGARSINYGYSTEQLTQINLIALHDAGYTADGVVVGILDTGFHRTHQAFNNPVHPLVVLAEYDFVDNDPITEIEPGDPSGQADHGTMILGCLGAYQPGSLVGGAYNASFVLAKTEDTTQEVPAEEDNYVAGLEFTEAHGVDMTTSSLGYIDWYTQSQLDGQTAVTTIACNIHTGNGVHHTNAAGNEYHDSDPGTSHLIAPADAFQVITCGAIDSSGAIAYFSSDGPTADGRVKPEVLARGISTYTVSPYSDNSYTTADGTSLSTPLVACAVACLIQAKPYWTVDQMRQHTFETADYYVANGTYDPLFVRGYGVVNAYAAYDTCSDAGVATLDRGKYGCASTAVITVNDCGLNINGNQIETVTVTINSTSEPAGEAVVLTELGPDAAEFSGSIQLSTTNAPGVLLVAPGDTVTVTYIDADNGQGQQVTVTATALVDCTGPTISNVHMADIQPHGATVAFNCDEMARGTVHYGLSCESLIWTAEGGFAFAPTVSLSGLNDNTTYYYKVDATDEAGNTTSDPTCRSFTTPEIPDFFTELFSNNNDLDNLSLSFTPNGSSDFYLACAEAITELPTDPTGGTTLSLSDDSYAQVNIGAGANVLLYGASYNHFYVGSNGYITFTSGDTNYTASLDAHFNQPRVTGLFDDLNPAQGGTVSWKQLSDRIVVTWLNVTEYGAGNQNTFQIELYFNGQLKINFLALACTHGLAGLSAGGGVPADFFMSDLSALGPCQTFPPSAHDGTASTNESTPVNITLLATDEGMPNPPGALSYTVMSLPAHGSLADPGAGAIASVPYTLVGYGKIVQYTPTMHYVGSDAFQFKAADGGTPPDGGDSNTATITITVIGVPERIYNFPLDSNPGWATTGAWAFGHPTGGGSHLKDPSNGYTGTNVYGYNLSGDYTNNLTPKYLTTAALNCTNVTGVELRFWRWLGVESVDHAGIDISTDGTTWTSVWSNATTISEAAWTHQTYNLAALADHQATVYLRWVLGPTDVSVTYPGWNIDDIEIWALVPAPTAAGDLNCDGTIGFGDINPFVLALTNPAAYATAYPNCNIMNGDINADGSVNFADINPFVALLTGK
jgi:hypothetical protein